MPVLKNIKLNISYEGTSFLGWQKTKEGPSIEQTLEEALCQILQQPIALQAASRTDRGVHAEGQIVNFLIEDLTLPLGRLQLSLNALLPSSIAINAIEEADPLFHPTLDALSKEYHYQIYAGPVLPPKYRHHYWHIYTPLDVIRMQEAARLFVGEKEFKAFCNQNKGMHYSDTRRHLGRLEIVELDAYRISIQMHANRFLYKMARTIAGTLVYIGQGKISLEEVPSFFMQPQRQKVGVTAPAQGLSLVKIRYGKCNDR